MITQRLAYTPEATFDTLFFILFLSFTQLPGVQAQPCARCIKYFNTITAGPGRTKKSKSGLILIYLMGMGKSGPMPILRYELDSLQQGELSLVGIRACSDEQKLEGNVPA